MSLAPGSRLASYEIVSLLGSGGMGEVYKAKDLKLGRFVAIKVLPEEHAGDAERLKRFEQEARSASALDHPNIITIHDIRLRRRHDGLPAGASAKAGGQVDNTEDIDFIVMQYVEGKTLRELAGTLELSQTLDYGEQIADGLARAHSHGIVHRDLKPENVMVTEDGLVKILDFGLAKLTQASDVSEDSTRDMELATREGRVIGTAPYMSPEQAQGKKIDHRSDIFSFGAVLYEMVTGRRAFQGDSFGGLIAAIIKDEPKSVGELVPSVPLDLQKLIARTMRKEPDRRSQSMADIKVELAEIRQAVDSGTVATSAALAKPERPGLGRVWSWRVAAVVAAVIAVLVWRELSTHQPPSLSQRTIPLTTFAGMERDPAISPDGTRFAFVWNGGIDRFSHLYVSLLEGGEPLQLTEAGAADYSPTWAPDGNRIAFLRVADGTPPTSEVRIVPALGGPETRLATIASVRQAGTPFSPGLDWSPDGRSLFTVEQQNVTRIDVATGEKTQVTFPEGRRGDKQPTISPDGTRVAFVRGEGLSDYQVCVQSADSGEPRVVASDESLIMDVAWMPDGKSLVYATGQQGERLALARAVGGGDAVQLGVGDRADSVSISPDGQRLVYSEFPYYDCDLFRIPGPAASKSSPPVKLQSSTLIDWSPEYSPDGTKIALVSGRSGSNQIFVCESDGSSCTQLSHQDYATSPKWSPDGSKIVYTGVRDGDSDFYTVEVESGFAERLTDESSRDLAPSWSHDGQWVYFTSGRSGGPRIWKIPVEGGDAVRVSSTPSTAALESHDGRFIYYVVPKPGRWRDIWRISLDGGDPAPVLEDVRLYRGRYFTLWNDSIVYLNMVSDDGYAFELLDPETGHRKRVADVPAVFYCQGVSVSPDGQWLLYSLTDRGRVSDIKLVENLR